MYLEQAITRLRSDSLAHRQDVLLQLSQVVAHVVEPAARSLPVERSVERVRTGRVTAQWPSSDFIGANGGASDFAAMRLAPGFGIGDPPAVEDRAESSQGTEVGFLAA